MNHTIINSETLKKQAFATHDVGEKLKNVADLIQAGIIVIDPISHKILELNSEAARLIGLSKEQILGQVCHKFICPAEVGKCPITDLGQKVDNAERCLLTVNKSSLPILKTVTRTVIDGEERLIESFLDISQMKALQQQLEQYATIDSLTEIPNRRYFFTQSEKEIERAKRTECPIAMAMIDIDYFKKVNDTYGHAAGDIVLKELATLCKNHIRPYDILGRLGGEEFAVTLVSINQQQALARMNEIRRAVEKHQINVNNELSIKVTISVGIASPNDEGESIESILNRADQALYRAKNNGRNRVESY